MERSYIILMLQVYMCICVCVCVCVCLTLIRTVGRPRRKWEDNIRMDLEEIGINAGNWVDSAKDMDF